MLSGPRSVTKKKQKKNPILQRRLAAAIKSSLSYVSVPSSTEINSLPFTPAVSTVTAVGCHFSTSLKRAEKDNSFCCEWKVNAFSLLSGCVCTSAPCVWWCNNTLLFFLVIVTEVRKENSITLHVCNDKLLKSHPKENSKCCRKLEKVHKRFWSPSPESLLEEK